MKSDAPLIVKLNPFVECTLDSVAISIAWSVVGPPHRLLGGCTDGILMCSTSALLCVGDIALWSLATAEKESATGQSKPITVKPYLKYEAHSFTA